MTLYDTDIGLLLIKGFSHIQCRELCEAAAGFKVSRINADYEQVEPLREWCRIRGLAFEVSDFGVCENLRDEGKGAWWNTGRRVPVTSSMRYVYVGKHDGQVSELKRLEASARPDHQRISELLRIPECCAVFYERFRKVAVNQHADDYAVLTSCSTRADPPYSWRSNYLAQYFGFSLIHHFPCRWDCPATIDRARLSEAVIEGISTDWLALHRRWLSAVVVVEGEVAVHHIRGACRDNAIRFKPGQVRSTANTPFLDHLRRVGKLVWTDTHTSRCEQALPANLLILPFLQAEMQT